jgi:hypothetical protein
MQPNWWLVMSLEWPYKGGISAEKRKDEAQPSLRLSLHTLITKVLAQRHQSLTEWLCLKKRCTFATIASA